MPPPQYMQRPEIALKRAKELLDVGRKQDALDTLHDVVKNRKAKQAWTKIHEEIMSKHLELCVELRKPHTAKDGLFQYRNMCQQINVKSLEEVILAFLDLAEKRADKATGEAQGMVEEIVDDLDQAENPETLLLKAVSGEDAQDRADRTVLSPWLKFLWESYRQCLELLRNNAQVETLYHRVAKQAFAFCLKYQRKSEFRKLCDNLRAHLHQLQKIQTQQHSVKLANPETQNYLQETRLIQLDVAIKMELWQEAFKSSDDLHNLMQSTKRIPKAQVMANYYEKLALIFWKAGNRLFHAASLLRLFLLLKEQKKTFLAEEAQSLATRVLLAVLSIQGKVGASDIARHLDTEESHIEHQRRLSSLLGLAAAPSRQGLIKDLQRHNVHSIALAPAQNLLQWLEVEFAPLRLATEVTNIMEELETTKQVAFTQYLDAIKELTAIKILKQISQIYQSITWERLQKVVPFFSSFKLEQMLVAAAKKLRMQVRIDQRIKAVILGSSEEIVSEEDDSANVELGATAPSIQQMPSEQIRRQLQQIYVSLQEAQQTIEPATKEEQIHKVMRNQITLYNIHARDAHKKMLERRRRIEAYKEQAEHVKERVEREKRELEQREYEERRIADQIRLDLETKEYQEQLRKSEQEKLKKRIMRDQIDKIKQTEAGRSAVAKLEQEEDLDDVAKILQEQVKAMEEQKRVEEEKLKQQWKKWDFFIRAQYEEEVPLIEQAYEASKDQDRLFWDQYEEDRVQRAVEQHELQLELSRRLKRMEEDAKEFLEIVRQDHAGELQKRIEEFEAKLEQERARRLEERKQQRKEARRQEWLKQKEEAERVKKEEEEAKRREMEDAQTRKEFGRTATGYRPPQAREAEKIVAPPPTQGRAALPEEEGGDGISAADTAASWRSSSKRSVAAPPPRDEAPPQMHAIGRGPPHLPRDDRLPQQAHVPPPLPEAEVATAWRRGEVIGPTPAQAREVRPGGVQEAAPPMRRPMPPPEQERPSARGVDKFGRGDGPDANQGRPWRGEMSRPAMTADYPPAQQSVPDEKQSWRSQQPAAAPPLHPPQLRQGPPATAPEQNNWRQQREPQSAWAAPQTASHGPGPAAYQRPVTADNQPQYAPADAPSGLPYAGGGRGRYTEQRGPARGAGYEQGRGDGYEQHEEQRGDFRDDHPRGGQWAGRGGGGRGVETVADKEPTWRRAPAAKQSEDAHRPPPAHDDRASHAAGPTSGGGSYSNRVAAGSRNVEEQREKAAPQPAKYVPPGARQQPRDSTDEDTSKSAWQQVKRN